MRTVKELNEETVKCQHQLAVWETAFDYLERFLAKDGRDHPAIRALNCLQEQVPEEVIDGVLEELANGPIKRLKERIEEIQSIQVQDPGGKPNEPEAPKAKKGRTPQA